MTASEAEFFNEQSNDFEVFHNRIPKDQYRAIQDGARANVNTVFSDIQIPSVNKKLKV
jgi:hypothetical protein